MKILYEDSSFVIGEDDSSGTMVFQMKGSPKYPITAKKNIEQYMLNYSRRGIITDLTQSDVAASEELYAFIVDKSTKRGVKYQGVVIDKADKEKNEQIKTMSKIAIRNGVVSVYFIDLPRASAWIKMI